ncbi:MAG: DUF2849 domain-containing protein [Gammaproteobacteria bacterium]|nr:DUF2849 domain-containing protein [Gammaproteobacteria bacterium]
MKSDEFGPVVVSANDLLTGNVIFLTEKPDWTTNIHEAYVINDKAESCRWLLEGEVQQSLFSDNLFSHVVDPYLVELKIDKEVISFCAFKEALRYYGPSNYFHGKRDWEIV